MRSAASGASRTTARGGSRLRAILAQPRGFCAGVTRAIAAVEQALELYGPPVYVRPAVPVTPEVIPRASPPGGS